MEAGSWILDRKKIRQKTQCLICPESRIQLPESRAQAMYKTGDILIVPTWPVPLFNHFAIVFYRDGIPYVAHNSFRSMINREDRNILIEPLDTFLKLREIRAVISTDGRHTDEEIYSKAIMFNEQGKKYNFFGYNCEGFVREICGCSWGVDQRKEFLVFFLGIIVLVAAIYFIFRR